MYLAKLHNIRMLFMCRRFSTTQTSCLIQKWRREKGLPLNPNACGVLTDKADYTYLDGRPTPLGARQKKRILHQEEIAADIINLTKEIDFAVEHHKQRQASQMQLEESIIKNKFKPKGKVLL